MLSSFITGVEGLSLSSREKRFLTHARPCGLILFARNCDTPDQVKALIGEFKSAVGESDVIISIDQEGGRVQRLVPPHWRALPPAKSYGRLWCADAASAIEKTRLASHLMAQELRALGINTNMVPVLDLPQPDAHEIISDRAYGNNIEQVVALGRATAEGHMNGGVLPVMKHIPGHGRALADSHEALPIVETPLAELQLFDFAPFRQLKMLPAAMTAHVVYSDIDSERPASTSKIVHEKVIRGDVGFNGLLMSDDLSMKALKGGFESRAGAVLAAGSDVALHCNGDMTEMQAIGAVIPPLSGKALQRFAGAMQVIKQAQPVDICAAEAAIGESLSVTL